MSKRILDLFVSVIGCIIFFIPIGIVVFFAAIDTKSNGLFLQKRVGQFGNLFTIYKLRTIHSKNNTLSGFGKFLRKYKLDELPQLLNVVIGDMSLVGPRPDVPGYYDTLTGEERKVLQLKPGITSLASIKYRNEEYLLSKQENPLQYNDTVIFPDKVKMNLEYYYNQTLFLDLTIIVKTFI